MQIRRRRRLFLLICHVANADARLRQAQFFQGKIRDGLSKTLILFLKAFEFLQLIRAHSTVLLAGYECAEELDGNKAFFDRMEAVRIEAGELMGMGDVSKSVTPKFGLVAPARDGGTLAVRYFMPWKTHPTMAVTGAQCMASCALTPGTVADGLLDRPTNSPAEVILEHASGKIDVLVDFSTTDGFTVNAAGLVRTARKLADGHVYVPQSVWDGS